MKNEGITEEEYGRVSNLKREIIKEKLEKSNEIIDKRIKEVQKD